MAGRIDYSRCTKASLIERIEELEAQLGSQQSTKVSEQPHTQNVVDDHAAASAATASQSSNGAESQSGATTSPVPKAGKKARPIDPSRYATRYIALKLAYLGKEYGGFEFSDSSKQPSIEEELWKALTKAHLIFPEDEREVRFECCDYSKCGRTDRGVSAFGQVIGLRVRSNRPVSTKRAKIHQSDPSSSALSPSSSSSHQDAAAIGGENGGVVEDESSDDAVTNPFDPVGDEICYAALLNRLLPRDIRVLAWCPSPPPGFSARFSCRERQYRYFFTLPAFPPGLSTGSKSSSPGGGNSREGVKEGWLDIEAMRDAAKRFEGEHDFRNFCKIDPTKQITNFSRNIFESDIVEVVDTRSALPYLRDADFAAPSLADGPHPKVYYFHVRGSAFLWHQIRHMVAILFLVGQGLEAPSIVSELLDVSKNPRKPGYAMASEVPLVLWDCIFPSSALAGEPSPDPTARLTDALEWLHVGDERLSNRFGPFSLVDNLWQLWRGRKMDELLAHQLLQQVTQYKVLSQETGLASEPVKAHGKTAHRVRLFQGDDLGRLAGRYRPLMSSKDLMSPPEEQNERYARRKGYASAAKMRMQKRKDKTRDEGEAED